MTVFEAITRLNALKPNQYDEDTLVSWLSELDGLIFNEIMLWHEAEAEFAPYDPGKKIKKELLAPEPYDGVYLKYLMAQVDFHNGEFNRYNNSMIMYNTALSAFADWYNRNNMPKQESEVRL